MDPILRQILNTLKDLAVFVATRLGLIDLSMQKLLGDVDLIKAQVQLLNNGQATIMQMLGQLQQQVSAIKGGVTVDLTPVITAVNTRASATVAPTWWIPPPAPTGAPTSTDNADAVWGYAMPFGRGITIDALSEAREFAHNAGGKSAFMLGGSPCLAIQGTFYSNHQSSPASHPPVVNVNSIVAGEGILDWLNRTTGFVWGYDVFNGNYPTTPDDPSNDYVYICLWTQADFEFFQKGYPPPPGGGGAPVWPGLAGVTLGTPVALDVGLTVTTPMHGCLISLTSVPIKQGYFTFDDVKSYRNVGAVAFVSDDGQEEYPQTLGFESAVYCPKTMVAATAVKVRTAAGIVGTITPFTIP